MLNEVMVGLFLVIFAGCAGLVLSAKKHSKSMLTMALVCICMSAAAAKSGTTLI